jgi:hypothetical protein
MRRALALLALAAAAALAALSTAAPGAPSPAGPGRGPPRAAGEAKPLPPLELTLQAEPPSGEVVPVSFVIRPLIEMSSVRWEWELSPGLRMVGGATEGEARGGRDETTLATAALSVPAGRYGRATLRVSGTFLGSDAEGRTALETVRVQGALTWDAEPGNVPAVQQVLSPDAETGVVRTMAAVPVSWGPP